MGTEPFTLRSAGDLEVVALYESHSLFAEIIGPDYYEVNGSPPTELRFHSSTTFWNYYVHVGEFLAQGNSNVVLDGKPRNMSLLDALEFACATRARLFPLVVNLSRAREPGDRDTAVAVARRFTVPGRSGGSLRWDLPHRSPALECRCKFRQRRARSSLSG
jgi:hypothetical protein